MDLDFSDEQEMLRRSAREFVKRYIPKPFVKEMEDDPIGFTDDIWKQMVQLGWPAWVVPEEYGGVGGSFTDIMVLLEEMGNGCLPSPFFSTVILGALPIIDAGNEQQKQQYLPAIASGAAYHLHPALSRHHCISDHAHHPRHAILPPFTDLIPHPLS